MAEIRQYIGARYVPKFVGEWNATTQYNALEVVDNGSGTSYISRKTVPAGTPLTDTEYWAVYGASSGAIVDLQTRMGAAENDIDDLQDDVTKLNAHLVYNVKSYGAIGDGITDDTTAILNALADCNTKKGCLYFPAGRYKVTQTIEFTADGVTLAGENVHGTYIYAYHDGAAVKFNGSASNAINGAGVKHIGIINYGDNVTRHAGLEFNYVVNSFIDDVIIEGFHTGAHLNHAGNTFVYRTGIVTDKASAYGFRVLNNCSSSAIRDSYASFGGAAGTTAIGLYASDGINDFLIDYFDVANGGQGVLIDATSNGTTEPADIRLHEVVVDNSHYDCIKLVKIGVRGNVLIEGGWLNPHIAAGSRCINLDDCENITIKNVVMQQLSDSATPTVSGVAGNTIKKVIVEGCRFMNIASPATIVTAYDTLISDNIIETYSGMTAANGVYIGTVQNASVINNRIVGYDKSVNIGAGARLIISLNHLVVVDYGSATGVLYVNNIVGGSPTP